MIYYSFFTIILTFLALIHSKEGIKTYSVKKIQGAILVSGKGDHPHWKEGNLLSDFSYPWETTVAPSTKFKAVHNDEWVYFLFQVKDENINIFVDKNHKSEVASSCRAEIFFKVNDRLSPYYCLEIDPLGRVLDYKAKFYRKFDTLWSWPPGHLVIKTEQKKDGYVVEFAISKDSLKKLGLLKNQNLQAGLYRGDCLNLKENCTEFKWISWVNPDSKTPDFHIPSSFGMLRLEELSN